MSDTNSAQPAMIIDGTDMTTFDAMGAALVERGIMTADQVAAERAAKEGGVTASADAVFTPMANGQSSSLDAVVFQGATNPAEYNFGNLTSPHGQGLDPDYQAFETTLRHSFIEAKLPAGIGNEFAKLVYQSMSKPPMSPYEMETAYQSTTAQLRQMWGNDFERNLAAANRVIDSMGPGAELVKGALRGGLGNNAWLIASMFNVAQARGLVG